MRVWVGGCESCLSLLCVCLCLRVCVCVHVCDGEVLPLYDGRGGGGRLSTSLGSDTCTHTAFLAVAHPYMAHTSSGPRRSAMYSSHLIVRLWGPANAWHTSQ